MTDKTPDIDQMNFEQALSELEKIVGALEGGKAPLDESINAYERGIKLKQHCEKMLNAAQEKIEKITITPDGNIATEPF